MTTLCYIDTETTGLNPRIHQPYEVAYWREDAESPIARLLPHTLDHADQQALAIGRYWERGNFPFPGDHLTRANVALDLRGVTLVGSNPAFDAAMLTRYIGTPVWHHRMIDIAAGAMWVFDLDTLPGLAETADRCRAQGFEIPEPDHTAEGDVRATRAVYHALRSIRSDLAEADSAKAPTTTGANQ